MLTILVGIIASGVTLLIELLLGFAKFDTLSTIILSTALLGGIIVASTFYIAVQIRNLHKQLLKNDQDNHD